LRSASICAACAAFTLRRFGAAHERADAVVEQAVGERRGAQRRQQPDQQRGADQPRHVPVVDALAERAHRERPGDGMAAYTMPDTQSLR
jgi:hypothetical protein